MEAEAVLSILAMADAKTLELASSDIIEEEIAQIPDDERRGKVELLLGSIVKHVALTARIEQRATELQTWNIPLFDALHLASAEAAGADFFLTTDDNLLRRSIRCIGRLKVKVENPVKWLIQESMDEN